MTVRHRLRNRRGSRRERGQVLVIFALALVVLLGFAGLVVDIGRVWVAQRQLQQAVDAAALVAGQDLPKASTAYGDAVAYSAYASGKNAKASLSANAPVVTFKCLTFLANNNVPCTTDSSGNACQPPGAQAPSPAGSTKCNAVSVSESASVKTTFLGFFLPQFSTVTATSTAAARGGVPHPLDIMVVLDSTGSMTSACGDTVQNEDGTTAISSGSSTDIDCAKDGVRRLLKSLVPCALSVVGNCGSTSTNPALDEVGMMVFPALTSPSGYTHDSTNGGAHTNLSLEFGCPGKLQPSTTLAPTWYLPGDDEQQTVAVKASGGSFKLTFGGQTTIAIPYGSTAATVQSDLAALSSIGAGNISVALSQSGSTSTYTLTYVGALGNTNQAQITSSSSLTGSGNSITITTPTGGSGSNPGGFPGWYFDGSEVSYGGSASYQIAGLSNDYKLADNSTSLNAASNVVLASTWDSCPGGTYPGNPYYGVNANGGAGTYYAGAIAAAQTVLAADTDPSRKAQKVIILLSDGDANRQADGSSSVESGNNPCHDAVTAAQNAATAGTWIYSIAYNASTSSSSSCQLDQGTYSGYSAFYTMSQIARNSTSPNTPDPTKFFCDPVPSGQTCNSASTLAEIFQSIGTDLTASRVLPDSTS